MFECCFWVLGEDAEYGSILAENRDEAEKLLFQGILDGEFPIDSILVEEIIDEDVISIKEIK